MDENLDDKNKSYSERIKLFFKMNKFKILLFIFIFFINIYSFILNMQRKKNNILISEKYIKAGLLLSKNENENAKNYYEEIVLSENKFYFISVKCSY